MLELMTWVSEEIVREPADVERPMNDLDRRAG